MSEKVNKSKTYYIFLECFMRERRKAQLRIDEILARKGEGMKDN